MGLTGVITVFMSQCFGVFASSARQLNLTAIIGRTIEAKSDFIDDQNPNDSDSLISDFDFDAFRYNLCQLSAFDNFNKVQSLCGLGNDSPKGPPKSMLAFRPVSFSSSGVAFPLRSELEAVDQAALLRPAPLAVSISQTISFVKKRFSEWSAIKDNPKLARPLEFTDFFADFIGQFLEVQGCIDFAFSYLHAVTVS